MLQQPRQWYRIVEASATCRRLQRCFVAAAPATHAPHTYIASAALRRPRLQRPQRRASRGKAGKRLRYNEDSDGEEDGEEGER